MSATSSVAESVSVVVESMEQLEARQRRELKTLQSEITRLKKSATKGDKKRKKEVMDEIAQLESSIATRHEQEMADLHAKLTDTDTAASTNSTVLEPLQTEISTMAGVSALDGSTSAIDVTAVVAAAGTKKVSKAQKRRERKEHELDQIRKDAEEEAANIPNLREDEASRMEMILQALNLSIYEIPSNGDCLFAAVMNQLHPSKPEFEMKQLRQAAAEWMRTHQDEFMPFLTDDDGEVLTDHQFAQYCDSIETTATWGGQLEINALSSYLQRTITVFQANGPPIRTGTEYEHLGPPILLSYHRHLYTLGEHYNSLRPTTN